MNRDWTVDTCVLYKAADVDLKAMHFLGDILEEMDIVALDHERCIDNEYERCINKITFKNAEGRTFILKWYKHIVGKLFTRFSGNLEKRHKKALKKLNFHDKDLPFVAVCKQTKDNNLVSEDSGYNSKVKEYLLEKMEVHVLSIQDSLNLCKQ